MTEVIACNKQKPVARVIFSAVAGAYMACGAPILVMCDAGLLQQFWQCACGTVSPLDLVHRQRPQLYTKGLHARVYFCLGRVAILAAL